MIHSTIYKQIIIRTSLFCHILSRVMYLSKLHESLEIFCITFSVFCHYPFNVKCGNFQEQGTYLISYCILSSLETLLLKKDD